MGDDLEARLRTHAQATAWNPFGEMCAEAAEEIRKLRFALECREVEIAQLSARRSGAEIARLQAEREKLLDACLGLMDLVRHFLGHECRGHQLPPAEEMWAVVTRACAATVVAATSSPSASGPS
jgi:hypothetical protein